MEVGQQCENEVESAYDQGWNEGREDLLNLLEVSLDESLKPLLDKLRLLGPPVRRLTQREMDYALTLSENP